MGFWSDASGVSGGALPDCLREVQGIGPMRAGRNHVCVAEQQSASQEHPLPARSRFPGPVGNWVIMIVNPASALTKPACCLISRTSML